MSTSKFAFFCIVLFFFATFHECVNKVDAAALTCTRLPNSNWCCNTTPRRCRGSKVECDAICKPKRL
ncbi:BnaCnng55330D [Brassica napus]|uniref:(rape) hypothetical protein n=1 Tax=Brassica napus TaxID=3708 RepID=A0A078JIU4_BRANA|nr:unnamed protein product [Brassica napus]CDY67498.1 BnaCnng55330D [Brassica napus]